jgi:hypothetical protein
MVRATASINQYSRTTVPSSDTLCKHFSLTDDLASLDVRLDVCPRVNPPAQPKLDR